MEEPHVCLMTHEIQGSKMGFRKKNCNSMCLHKNPLSIAKQFPRPAGALLQWLEAMPTKSMNQ